MGKCENQVDSGWSWVIAAACCFTNCMLYGVTRLSGMLLHPAVESYGVSRGAAALPFTTSSAVRNLSGPIVGFLGQHFGIRPVAATGCLLASLGAGLCFFTHDIIWTTICWGGIFGIGLGLSTSLLPSAINQNFDKHTATASGISYSGSYIGSFIFPALVLFLLEKYDLQGTFLVLSGFILNSLVAIMLLRPPSLPSSLSNKKSVYVIDYEKNDTEPSSIGQIKIDSLVIPDAKPFQGNVTDTTGQKNGEALRLVSKHFDERVAFHESSEENSVSIVQPEEIRPEVLCEEIETSDQFFGLLLFTKDTNFHKHFPLQDFCNVANTEREEQRSFTNLPLKDIILRIQEHVTSRENSSTSFQTKREETDTLRFEFCDTQNNRYSLLQFSEPETETLLRDLRSKYNKSRNNNSWEENSGDLMSWGIFRKSQFTTETESSARFQKFTKWKISRRSGMLNISENSSAFERISYCKAAKDMVTSKTGRNVVSIFRNTCNVPLFSNLAQRFRDRKSTVSDDPICKSFSLDSSHERSTRILSSCSQCIIADRSCDNTIPKGKICESIIADLLPTSKQRTLDQFKVDSIQCKCVSFSALSHQVPTLSSPEEPSAASPRFNIITFLTREQLFNYLEAESEQELRQSNCVAILFLCTAQNNHSSSPRTRESVINLNAKNLNNCITDQNQNFLDPVHKSKSVQGSTDSDLSVIVINKEMHESRHLVLRKRVRSWCSVFCNPMFLLISVTMAVYSFVMVCIITVIEDYARDIEHENVSKPYVLMVLSAADLCGTLGLGWITDRGFLSRKNFTAICFCGMAISCMAIAFTTEIILLCIFVAMYGLFESGVVITFPLLTAQFIRIDKQTIAIASSNSLSAPAILLVPFVIGYFRDYMGSYRILFYLLSVTSAGCGMLWVLVPYILKKYTLKFKGIIT